MSESVDAEQALPSKSEAVPNEFRGRARAFRRRLEADDIVAGAAMDRIAARLKPRAAKGKPPRPETVIDATREWRAIPASLGRLALEVNSTKSSLHINELRISSATSSFEHFPEIGTEQGVCVLLTHFEASSKSFWFGNVYLAGISLHALARRFQRGFDTSDEALKRDFRALADASTSDDLLGLRDDFRIPAPGGGGIWVGASSITEEGTGEQRIFSVRSFIPE